MVYMSHPKYDAGQNISSSQDWLKSDKGCEEALTTQQFLCILNS